MLPPPAEKLQNFFGVFLQFHIGVDIGLSHEERLDWLREHQYSLPISFEREVGGTVYAVNAHFSNDTAEPVEKKVIRILNRNIAH